MKLPAAHEISSMNTTYALCIYLHDVSLNGVEAVRPIGVARNDSLPYRRNPNDWDEPVGSFSWHDRFALDDRIFDCRPLIGIRLFL